MQSAILAIAADAQPHPERRREWGSFTIDLRHTHEEGGLHPPYVSQRRKYLFTPSLGERVFAQEVEVTAAVGLQDLVAVEAGVAALGDWR